MKYLIVGLGNIGAEYDHTRHNIGFDVMDALAAGAEGLHFVTGRKAQVAELKYKGRKIFLLKPTTYVNLSGEAVVYWMQQEKIALENLLVVTDDLALPFGTIRLKPKGGSAGHNGLTSIIEHLQTDEFSRIRFGIGSDFAKGHQVNFVLGKWDKEEQKQLPLLISTASDMVKSFAAIGLQLTMNKYNNRQPDGI